MHIHFIHDHARAEWDDGAAERTARLLYGRLAPILRRAGHTLRRIGTAHPAVQTLLAPLLDPAPGPRPPRHWPTLFSGPATPDPYAALTRALAASDLVLGFELSPNQLASLQAAGLAVLDIAIDPVRFGPDLYLSLRTNDPGLARRLAAAAIPHSDIPHPPTVLAPRPPRPQTLFVGQTDIDAALVCNARLATIDDWLPTFRARYGEGTGLLLKPHPYGRTHHAVRTLHAALPRARITTDNVYALLASRTVTDVITLSSGVALEARLFQIPATSLLRPDNTDLPGLSPRFRISHHALPMLLDPASALVCTKPLRVLLGVTWAYPPPVQCRDDSVTAGQGGPLHANAPSTRLLAFGWSHPEPTGIWTEGPLATLLLDPAGQALELTLRCKAFVPRAAAPLRVAVHIDGTPAQSLRFDSGRPRTITIALPATNGPVEVALHIENPRTPESTGLSNDRRALGLHVAALKIRPAAIAHPTWNATALRTMAASILTALMGV